MGRVHFAQGNQMDGLDPPRLTDSFPFHADGGYKHKLRLHNELNKASLLGVWRQPTSVSVSANAIRASHEAIVFMTHYQNVFHSNYFNE
ncbi:hypothetical protein CEXT_73641 [Caerostris extrusa]|uniref:Uncharacterized protein n=1 Tax=Caerostris extrusa TaxID=172846 RepID=A0AAV4QWW3_CAEEX|nr:hypothetical protein CEXT_73641 [Caerostris extrusa]